MGNLRLGQLKVSGVIRVTWFINIAREFVFVAQQKSYIYCQIFWNSDIS